MPSPAPQIDDPDFARAVSLLDAGDVEALRSLLRAHPRLLSATSGEDGSFAGPYFRDPTLLCFVADNPVRKGKVPDNVTDVASAIVELAREHNVADLPDQLDRTLGLVASGRIVRQCGQQRGLIGTLVQAGADPDRPMRAALAHRELEAVEHLLAHGATRTRVVAAGLGDLETLQNRFEDASSDERFEALVIAAINGRSTAARILVDRGVDPNRYAPQGLHAHATPLHLAVNAGSVSTVCTLVTRGADPTIRDKLWNGTALGWAKHQDQDEIAAFLREAEVFMPAVVAVRTGDDNALRTWLSTNPDRIDAQLGDNPRSLLHYATDWPGHPPNVGATISTLLAAGANPDVRLGDDGETPLHWAASSDDLDAADALIDGGAALMPRGGCIADGTPLDLAVIFGKWRVAKRLLDAGATLAPHNDPRWDEAVARAPEALRTRIRDAVRGG